MKVAIITLTVLYIFFGFALPTFRIWKRTGINPISFSNEDTPYNYIGNVFKTIMAILVLNNILFFMSDNWVKKTYPITHIENWMALKWVGLILMVLALTWIVIAQYNMANSWRIGIDLKNETQLVSHGLFRYSRNPIFLGLNITLLGIFLIIPNLIMTVVLFTGYLSIQIQVRLEEEFLNRTKPIEYANYKKQVRRWI